MTFSALPKKSNDRTGHNRCVIHTITHLFTDQSTPDLLDNLVKEPKNVFLSTPIF